MRGCLLTCTALLAITGCDVIEEMAPLPPEPTSILIFEVPLLGEVTRSHFATLTLFRDGENRSRLVLLALEPLEHARLSIALPNCLAPVGGSAQTSWSAGGLQPGSYVWSLEWRKIRTKCAGNGTLLYEVSGQYNGDRGSIPFPWLSEA